MARFDTGQLPPHRPGVAITVAAGVLVARAKGPTRTRRAAAPVIAAAGVACRTTPPSRRACATAASPPAPSPPCARPPAPAPAPAPAGRGRCARGPTPPPSCGTRLGCLRLGRPGRTPGSLAAARRPFSHPPSPRRRLGSRPRASRHGPPPLYIRGCGPRGRWSCRSGASPSPPPPLPSLPPPGPLQPHRATRDPPDPVIGGCAPIPSPTVAGQAILCRRAGGRAQYGGSVSRPALPGPSFPAALVGWAPPPHPR